jgi:hypothetical protein
MFDSDGLMGWMGLSAIWYDLASETMLIPQN